jgi:hypothetical protein
MPGKTAVAQACHQSHPLLAIGGLFWTAQFMSGHDPLRTCASKESTGIKAGSYCAIGSINEMQIWSI